MSDPTHTQIHLLSTNTNSTQTDTFSPIPITRTRARTRAEQGRAHRIAGPTSKTKTARISKVCRAEEAENMRPKRAVSPCGPAWKPSLKKNRKYARGYIGEIRRQTAARTFRYIEAESRCLSSAFDFWRLERAQRLTFTCARIYDAHEWVVWILIKDMLRF